MSKQIPHRVNTTATKTSCSDVTALIADFENIWDKIFKNGPSKICGRQPITSDFLKAVFHKFLLGPFLNTSPHILPVGTPGLRTCSVLTLKDQIISESCIEIKTKVNFYFHTSSWCLKRFFEGLKGLHKTFWDTTRFKAFKKRFEAPQDFLMFSRDIERDLTLSYWIEQLARTKH